MLYSRTLLVIHLKYSSTWHTGLQTLVLGAFAQMGPMEEAGNHCGIWRTSRASDFLFLSLSVGGSVGKESACNVETWVRSLGWEDPVGGRKERLPTPVFWPGEFHGESLGSQRVEHGWATFTSLMITSLLKKIETWQLVGFMTKLQKTYFRSIEIK